MTAEERTVFDAARERGPVVRATEPRGGHLLATTDTAGYGTDRVAITFESRTHTVRGRVLRTNHDERRATAAIGLLGGGATALAGLLLGLAGKISRL